MQTLIQDLLAYSSEQIFKKEFWKATLSTIAIVEEVKEDLEQDLEEKYSYTIINDLLSTLYRSSLDKCCLI
jgi:hypothetical protein